MLRVAMAKKNRGRIAEIWKKLFKGFGKGIWQIIIINYDSNGSSWTNTNNYITYK